jgi:2-hydroxy-3-keto-5-methylthiopentenyl-1-phosphate phosphatase
MHDIRLASLTDCVVFFDFDNTITPFDILDDIIKRFSTNKDWRVFESAWKRGEIGSRECLEGQLRSVRISRGGLVQYLSRIKVDPHVHRLFNLLIREGIKPVVLSDSFTFIIRTILGNNGIKIAKIYANRLNFFHNRLIPSFPYEHKRCISCAHCKKKNLLRKDIRDKVIIYIGDGISDICPAECADIVFAKGSLLKYFRRAKRLCLAFDKLDDIYKYFRGLEK